MTSTIAIIGKSGSGKTTFTKALKESIKEKFPSQTILLVDNDLTLELSDSFGIKTKNTLYGIKSGKHEYKTGIPEGMSKQEYIEWAIEDIIVNIDDNIDLIASWLVTPKDCTCIATKLMRDSLKKLIERYDFVIFDSEYDLKYLNALIDCKIDETIVVTNSKKEDIALASKICETSKKYANDGQLEIVINKAKKENLDMATKLIKDLDLSLLGIIEEYDEIDYKNIKNKIDSFYIRMNLPQENTK